MGKNGKKPVKAQRAKKAQVKGLPVKDATAVKGGRAILTTRKAGIPPPDYL